MEYIVTKHWRGNCLGGRVNLPYGTVCVSQGDEPQALICRKADGLVLCLGTSQDAYNYLSRDDDGRGRERGALVQEILRLVQITPNPSKADRAEHNARWGRLWADRSLAPFRRRDHPDFWVWSYEFYNADVSDLQKILKTTKGE